MSNSDRSDCMKVAGIAQDFTPYARALSETNQKWEDHFGREYKRRAHKYFGGSCLAGEERAVF